MKKIFCLAILFLLLPLLAFAQNNFHFSLAPQVSLSFGELTELLYYNDGTLVSQLDWEQKPLLNLGVKACCQYKDFIVAADFDYSLPLGTSNMYDSDWENNVKYSFTEHPLESSKNIDTSLSLAYQIRTTQKIHVIPTLQFNYIYTDFEAANGSGTRNGRNIRVYGVDYKRHSFFIFAGAAIKIQPLSFFGIQAEFLTAPWLYQNSFDYHHGKKHPFSSRDIQYGFFTKYKAGLTTDFIFTPKLSLQLFTNLLFGFPDKGPIYSDYNSTNMEKSNTQQSGAAIHYIKFGTSLKIIF